VLIKKRDTGIKALGSVPWGTRIWVFYDTKQDLFDTMSACIRAGLESNELCSIIIASNSSKTEAIKKLEEAFPELSQYLEKGSVEFATYDKIRINNRLIDIWEAYAPVKAMFHEAEEKSLDGVRTIIDLSRLKKGDWKQFINGMPKFDELIVKDRYLGICMYPLDRCQADEFIYVMKHYKYVLINRGGNFTRISDARSRHAWKEISRSPSNYQSVIQNMRKALKDGEEKFLEYVRSSGEITSLSTLKEGKFIEISEEFCKLFGYTREEIIGRTSIELNIWPNVESREAMVKRLNEQGMILNAMNEMRTKSGEKLSVFYSNELITIDDVPYGFSQNQ
jgi:PAS domain S-box-containing protein